MHRSDLLAILYDACQAQGVGLHPDQDVRAVTDAVDAATAECADGSSYRGAAVIAADGLHSGVRRLFTPTISPSARASPPTAARQACTR